MEEVLEALVGKKIEETEELASGQIKITFEDGSFVIVNQLATSEELGIEVSDDTEEPNEDDPDEDDPDEDDPDEDDPDEDEAKDDPDDDENIDAVADILDVDPDDVAEAIDKAKKKVLVKVCKELDLDTDDYDDTDEMREGIKEELDLEDEDWDDDDD